MKKFERAGYKQPANVEDGTGNVVVRIHLLNEGKQTHVKGNISKSLTVAKAKVSEVYKAIEKALFE